MNRIGNCIAWRTVIAVAVCSVLAMVAVSVNAADMQFMGEAITPAPGRFLVEKDVNFRAEPRTEGKRLGMLEAGKIINVVGRLPNSQWVAVVKKGKPLGFVYGSVLSPIVDGQIDEDVTGDVQVDPKIRCGFRVHFIGKSEGVDDSVRTSDYDASIVCERDGARIRFPAQMFITEVPFDGSNKAQVFQINVDLLDTVHALPDVFSTTLMFDLDKGEVRFDQMTEKTYKRQTGGLESLPATDVARALSSALEIALSNWSATAWDDIFARAG